MTFRGKGNSVAFDHDDDAYGFGDFGDVNTDDQPNQYDGIDAQQEMHRDIQSHIEMPADTHEAYNPQEDVSTDTQSMDQWLSENESSQNPSPAAVEPASLSNEEFIQQAYQSVLGREADAGGADYWTQALENGMSREDIIAGFQNSDEYKALHTPEPTHIPEPMHTLEAMNAPESMSAPESPVTPAPEHQRVVQHGATPASGDYAPIEQYLNNYPHYATNSPADIEFRRMHPYGEFVAGPDNSDGFMNHLGNQNPHAGMNNGALSLASEIGNDWTETYVEGQGFVVTYNVPSGSLDLTSHVEHNSDPGVDHESLQAWANGGTPPDSTGLENAQGQLEGQLDLSNHVELNSDPGVDHASLEAWANSSSMEAVGAIQTINYSNPSENAVADLYRDLMGREPDAAGLKFWSGVLAAGEPIETVANALKGSDEYQSLQSQTGSHIDAHGGVVNADGTYSIDGVRYESKEAAFPESKNMPDHHLDQVISTAGGLNAEGIQSYLVEKFKDPSTKQVEIIDPVTGESKIYTRPVEGLVTSAITFTENVDKIPGGVAATYDLLVNKGSDWLLSQQQNGQESMTAMEAFGAALNAVADSANSHYQTLQANTGSTGEAALVMTGATLQLAYDSTAGAVQKAWETMNNPNATKEEVGAAFLEFSGAVASVAGAGAMLRAGVGAGVSTVGLREAGGAVTDLIVDAAGGILPDHVGIAKIDNLIGAVPNANVIDLNAARNVRAEPVDLSNLNDQAAKIRDSYFDDAIDSAQTAEQAKALLEGSGLPPEVTTRLGSVINESNVVDLLGNIEQIARIAQDGNSNSLNDILNSLSGNSGASLDQTISSATALSQGQIPVGIGKGGQLSQIQGLDGQTSLTDQFSELGSIPKQNLDAMRGLDAESQVTVRLGNGAEVTVKVDDLYRIVKSDPDQRFNIVDIPNSQTPDFDLLASKFDDSNFDPNLVAGVKTYTIEFPSGAIGSFTGNADSLAKFIEANPVNAFSVTEPPAWVKNVNDMHPTQFTDLNPTLDNLASQISDSSVKSAGELDIYGTPIYHGTINQMIDSVAGGAKDVGKGFGGPGLYIAIGEDRHIAESYASMAIDAAANRLSNVGQVLKEPPQAVIMEGRLNPDLDLRVGSFSITRNGSPDLSNGVLPALWADDPTLVALLKREFDVLEINGARSAGLNLDTDRFLVIHESAGPDAVRWIEARDSSGQIIRLWSEKPQTGDGQ